VKDRRKKKVANTDSRKKITSEPDRSQKNDKRDRAAGRKMTSETDMRKKKTKQDIEICKKSETGRRNKKERARRI
jgi:hypothetical protein